MSTYQPIATQTLGSATPSVTFSSLPQNYTDFIVVANYGISANLYGLRIRFNDDTGSNYSDTALYGNGSSATSSRDTSATSIITSAVGVTNNVLNYNFICNVQNYSNGSTYKTALVRANATDRETVAVVGLWRNTNPITSITIFVGSGNILSGSTFTIYGVAAGNSSAKASGGNIVTTDGSYWYHTFTSSGTFIPNETLTVDYLVVAGGGGGGWTSNNYAGGGGAGGLRSTVTATGGGGSLESPLSLSANTIYKAIIGAGGSVGGAYQTGYTRGFDSTFATITSVGGGNAALSSGTVGSSSNGSSGGSGGGATGNSGVGGSASPSGQGYAGGNSSSSSNGGGGGGAGEAGNTDGTSAGGDGVQITALATATGTGFDSGYYAGGGGGSGSSPGSGGLGGGGAGKSSGAGNPGLANSGGGGGGTNGAIPGNGGSGIIIVRYAV